MTIKGTEFLAALEEIETSKGIGRETVLRALEEAMIKGYRKQLGGESALLKEADVRVKLDLENNTIDMWNVKKVVSEIEDDFLELTVEDANALDPTKTYKEGDDFFIPASIEDLRKGIVLSIKSIVRQKFAEFEKGILYETFKDKIGTLISGKVEKVDERGISVNIVKTSVFLPKNQLIGDERFGVGDPIKLYVSDVASGPKGAHIVVSRSNEGFLKCVLQEDINDIYNGQITIKAIAREAGERSKVAVYSPDPNIDPAGACIGPNGSKIQKVVGKLGNGQSKEKIDIIAWSENPGLFIIEALKPAHVAGIVLDTEKRSAIAIVKDDSLSLAIGRRGVNARLAVKLTNYHIDIKTETEAVEEGITFKTFEEFQAEELERINKLTMEIAAAKAAAMAAQTASNTNTVLPGLPEGYVAPQQRVYDDENDDLNEALAEEAEKKEDYVSPVEEEPVSINSEAKVEEVKVDEVKVEEPVVKTTVKTTTSIEDLEASLETPDKTENKKSFKKTNKKKKDSDNEDSSASSGNGKVTDTSSAERMSIYTEEELREIEKEENEETSDYEDDDVDYDEYDEYYDDDNR